MAELNFDLKGIIKKSIGQVIGGPTQIAVPKETQAIVGPRENMTIEDIVATNVSKKLGPTKIPEIKPSVSEVRDTEKYGKLGVPTTLTQGADKTFLESLKSNVSIGTRNMIEKFESLNPKIVIDQLRAGAEKKASELVRQGVISPELKESLTGRKEVVPEEALVPKKTYLTDIGESFAEGLVRTAKGVTTTQEGAKVTGGLQTAFGIGESIASPIIPGLQRGIEKIVEEEKQSRGIQEPDETTTSKALNFINEQAIRAGRAIAINSGLDTSKMSDEDFADLGYSVIPGGIIAGTLFKKSAKSTIKTIGDIKKANKTFEDLQKSGLTKSQAFDILEETNPNITRVLRGVDELKNPKAAEAKAFYKQRLADTGDVRIAFDETKAKFPEVSPIKYDTRGIAKIPFIGAEKLVKETPTKTLLDDIQATRISQTDKQFMQDFKDYFDEFKRDETQLNLLRQTIDESSIDANIKTLLNDKINRQLDVNKNIGKKELEGLPTTDFGKDVNTLGKKIIGSKRGKEISIDEANPKNITEKRFIDAIGEYNQSKFENASDYITAQEALTKIDESIVPGKITKEKIKDIDLGDIEELITRKETKIPREELTKQPTEVRKNMVETETLKNKNKVTDILQETEVSPEKIAKKRNVSITVPTKSFLGKKLNELQNTDTFLNIQETFQDNWARVKRLMEREGVKFTDDSNPYQQHDLFHGVVGAMKENLDNKIKDIEKDVLKFSREKGISTDKLKKDVNEFLLARHAPERNAKLGDGAAGITDAEAKKIFDKLSGDTEVRNIANRLQEINDEVLDILKDGEVISDDLYKTLKETYPNHIPLQRVLDTDTNADMVEFLGTKGFKVKGTGLKRAKGSEKEIRDITGNIVANYVQALQRAEKNKVNLATLNLARENNYFNGLFEEIKPKAIGEDFKGNLIYQQINDPLALPLREKGKQVYLKINDPKLAKAFQSVNIEQLPALIRPIATITRFYASMATRFNPEFAFSNIIRDAQDLLVNTSDTLGGKSATKSATRIPKSMKDVTEWVMGRDTAGTKLYEQMRQDGGTTGGLGLSTREQIDIDLDKLAKQTKNPTKKFWSNLIKGVDNFNRIFEDATRLSAYKQALEDGYSRKQAAFIAKNATVNFNKKGTASPIINALYMFANASVQGTTRTLKALRKPKIAAAVAGTIGAATFMLRGQNDAIDPEWRDKVNQYDLNHSMVIVLPPKSDGKFRYVTIPVSWGLKPIKVMMDQSYDLYNGKSASVGDAIEKVTSSFLEAYNPIGGGDILSSLTPTVLDVPLEVSRNKAWHGGIIFPDWKEGLPASEQVFDSTSETLKGKTFIETSKLLDKLNLEISPEVLKYTFDQLVGGAGKSISRGVETIQGLFTGNDINPNDKFLINRFYKEKEPEMIEKQISRGKESQFREDIKNEKDIEKRKDMMREYIKDMTTEQAQGFLYKLQLDGFNTKNVSRSDNPENIHKPKIDDPIEAWYGYFRSKKFNYTPEEAMKFAESVKPLGYKDETLNNQIKDLDIEFQGLSDKGMGYPEYQEYSDAFYQVGDTILKPILESEEYKNMGTADKEKIIREVHNKLKYSGKVLDKLPVDTQKKVIINGIDSKKTFTSKLDFVEKNFDFIKMFDEDGKTEIRDLLYESIVDKLEGFSAGEDRAIFIQENDILPFLKKLKEDQKDTIRNLLKE